MPRNEPALPKPLGTEQSRDWMRRAACINHPNVKFFPDPSTDPTIYDEARTICDTCPVRNDCLEYALRHNIGHGMWGGYTPEQRHILQSDRGRPPV